MNAAWVDQLGASSLSDALAVLLMLAGVVLGVTAVRAMARALRVGHSLALIRAIRLVIFAAVALLIAVGVATGRTGFYVLAGVFLAEECMRPRLWPRSSVRATRR